MFHVDWQMIRENEVEETAVLWCLIYFEQFLFLLNALQNYDAVNGSLFLSKYRIVLEIYKLIPGLTQLSTWLQLNKLLMKLWKGVSIVLKIIFRSKFGDTDNRLHFFC
jgi:hypothetical protein